MRSTMYCWPTITLPTSFIRRSTKALSLATSSFRARTSYMGVGLASDALLTWPGRRAQSVRRRSSAVYSGHGGRAPALQAALRRLRFAPLAPAAPTRRSSPRAQCGAPCTLPLLLTALFAAAVFWQLLRLRSCMIEVDGHDPRHVERRSRVPASYRRRLGSPRLLAHARSCVPRSLEPGLCRSSGGHRCAGEPSATIRRRAAASELREGQPDGTSTSGECSRRRTRGGPRAQQYRGQGLDGRMRAKVEARHQALRTSATLGEQSAGVHRDHARRSAMLAVVLAESHHLRPARPLVPSPAGTPRRSTRPRVHAMTPRSRAGSRTSSSGRSATSSARRSTRSWVGPRCLHAVPDDPRTRQRALETIDRNARAAGTPHRGHARRVARRERAAEPSRGARSTSDE